jgi:hypothetical protein
MASLPQRYREFCCRLCGLVVHICSRCDRGQIYCPGECSEVRRQETIRSATRRYQESPLGARNHARRQRRYRARRRTRVTHQGSLAAGDVREGAPATAVVVARRALAAVVVVDKPNVDREVPSLAAPPFLLDLEPDVARCHFCGAPAGGASQPIVSRR